MMPENSAPPHRQRNFENATGRAKPKRIASCVAEVWSSHIFKIGKWDDTGIDAIAELLQNTPCRWPDPISARTIDRRSATKVRRNRICEPSQLFALESLGQIARK